MIFNETLLVNRYQLAKSQKFCYSKLCMFEVYTTIEAEVNVSHPVSSESAAHSVLFRPVIRLGLARVTPHWQQVNSL